jgi:BirA family biotin operon repressor/biotin-[acetyl-CoA-carboxylase] ligase
MTAPRLPDPFSLLAYDRLGSTNDEAKHLAQAGAASWTLVWARQQSAGRGRRQRVWESPQGNLYLSLILRPLADASSAAQLSFVAALAVGEALAGRLPAGAELRYKWPNDVLVDGRKIGGILLESAASASGRVEWLVIGLGVNIGSHPAEAAYPAISLAALAESGMSFENDGTLIGMVEDIGVAFRDWEARWRQDGFEPVRQAWLGAAQGKGGMVEIKLDRESFTGRFVDLDRDGALLVETEKGQRRVLAGDVFPVAA